MKCVRMNTDQKILRLSNADAEKTVKNGFGVYIRKLAWKAQQRGQAIQQDMHSGKEWLVARG